MSVTAVPLRPVSRRVLVMLWGGLAAAALVAGGLAYAGTGRAIAETGSPAQFLAWNAGQDGVVTTPSGLQYKVVEPGEGEAPSDSDVVLISYKGTLRDGTVFDQNERAPMEVAAVIPGFQEGLKQMRRGAKHRMWIKPELAYGEKGTPDGRIPANSVIVFDVELIDFIPATVLRQMQQQQQMGGLPGLPGMAGPGGR